VESGREHVETYFNGQVVDEKTKAMAAIGSLKYRANVVRTAESLLGLQKSSVSPLLLPEPSHYFADYSLTDFSSLLTRKMNTV
jgi:hypothetical protein